jgi:S1-C subfamily serine protease
VSIQIGITGVDAWVTIGTGVAVRKPGFGKMILTAAHVARVAPGADYRACNIYSDSFCVALDEYLMDSGGDSDDDWALYFVDDFPTKVSSARIGREPVTGSPVMTLGFPDGTLWYSYGHASVLTTGDVWGLDLWCRPGSSGGGVWNEQGQLIGIIHAIYIKKDLYGEGQMVHQQSIMVPISRIEVL